MTMMKREEQQAGVAPKTIGDAGDTVHDYAMRPPVLRLVQAQSGEGTPGNFRRSDTGEESETIDVIPLAIRATRLKYPKGEYNRDRKRECWSDDSMVAAPEALYAGRDCLTCEYRLNTIWEAKGTSNVDECLPTLAVVFLEAYSFEPLLFKIESKSAARIASIVRSNLRRSRLTLYCEAVAGDKGKFYSARMKTLGRLEEDDLAEVESMLKLFGGRPIVASDDDETNTTHAQTPPAEHEDVPQAPPPDYDPVVDTFTVPPEQMPLDTDKKPATRKPGMEP